MNFETWVKNIIDTEKPSDNIRGYYFGLFESAQPRYTLYLIGSEEFDKDDEDWACNDDFEPQNKYLPLPQYNDLGWEDVLNHVVEKVRNFMQSGLYATSFFTKAQGIGVGFDDGNITLVKS